jgi:propionyl-CoA carboxylase alpha chain
VEHPITELITGVDIVEQMIRIAAGHPLLMKQEDVPILGHATECRVYAEDPLNNFAPSIGTLERYVEPLDKEGLVRVDSGIEQGSEISVYYDPMISKLITFGKTREQSRLKMIEALDRYIITGVTHNISLLRSILIDQDYIKGKITTNFIHEKYPKGFKGIEMTSKESNYLLYTAGIVQLMNTMRGYSVSNFHEMIKEIVYSVEFKGDDKSEQEIKVKSISKNEFLIETSDSTSLKVQLEGNVGEMILKISFNNEAPLIIQIIEKTSKGYILQYKGTRFEITVMTPNNAKLLKHMPYRFEIFKFNTLLDHLKISPNS